MLSSLSHPPYPSIPTDHRPSPPLPVFLPSSPLRTSLPLPRTHGYKPSKSSLLHASLSHPSFSAAAAAAAHETVPRTAIQRIADKLRSLGYLEEKEPPSPPDAATATASSSSSSGPGSPGEIFIPTPRELPKHRVGHTIDSSWSTPESPVPVPGSGYAIVRFHELRRESGRDWKKVPPTPTPPMVAELTIPPVELKRLRSEGIRLDKRLKVGKAGITEGIVNGIHERWRHSELVKIKCEDLCRMNMKRTHEILERKTGGLVIWRSGSILILYRGADYKYPYFSENNLRDENVDNESSEDGNSSCMHDINSSDKPVGIPACSSLVVGVGSPKKVRFLLPGEAQLEEEADRLLDGLGPRFIDWWGCDPLPVDADLLPAIVPGHRKPFRLLPFGVKPKLTDREMTILRRLGRPLPCHFALGRNRNLQGLAVSMIKLWEKCELAKIAVKRGVQNTNSELMVEELKRLTGGTVLSRDKEFIVFYRGKDFLPPAVSNAIEERRNHLMYKEKYRADEFFLPSSAPKGKLSPAGPSDSVHQDGNEVKIFSSTKRRLKSVSLAVKTMEARLSQALEKKEKAEKLLEELEQSAGPPKTELDKEGISKEERYMLRKVGLRMKPFLLLGRRGIFDGTVENMHLHWKYRELVKIISKERCIEDVYRDARTLEAASGGILVAVERVNKGHAIIVYRGKNYRRPADLRPQTLLNKKEALKRSLEAQRHESLKLHVLKLSRNIDQMSHQLGKSDANMELVSSAESMRSNNVSTSDHFTSVECTLDQKFTELDGADEADVKSLHSIERYGTSSDMGENGRTLIDDNLISSKHEDEFFETELVKPFSEPGPDGNMDRSGYRSDKSSAQAKSPLQHVHVSYSVSNNSSHVLKDSSPDFSQSGPGSFIKETEIKRESDVNISFRAASLSNKERLVLRKQALNMKKRPVLAIGRSNVIAGVAKAIKTHFAKHPLAIVNVKGRAKGTSVQELVFELEQATGSVLVSREPNKVILYRGWGESEEPGCLKKGKRADIRETSSGVDTVSPELMAAISLECGLQTGPNEESIL